MIVDVDIGNSRIKWRTSLSPLHMYSESDERRVLDVWSGFVGVSRLRVASVVESPRSEEVLDWALQRWGVKPELAEVKDMFAGINIAYENTSALGVDRWLAMHAAKSECPDRNLIVVSAGTALTADYLTSSGIHLGGYIFPGWRAASNGLLGSVNRLCKVSPQLSKEWSPGNSTLKCIESGFAFTYRSLIRSFVTDVFSAADMAKLIISGGDGELMYGFAQEAKFDCIYNPLLVLQGLDVVLPSCVQ
jgi:type III pantothenate kinase